MSVPKDELHRLVESLPEEETPAVKRFLEFVLSEAPKKENQAQEEKWGHTFYIEGPHGKYAEMEFCLHIMELDDVKGWGRFTWYDEDCEPIPSGDVDFNKNHLPLVWPVYFALAAKCTIDTEPFLSKFSLEEIKVYVGIEGRDAIPKTLSSNLEVAKLMWSGKTYPEAINIVTQRRNLKSEHTVADQCTRQMGRLNTEQFKELVGDKEKFIDHLKKHFPAHEALIIKELS